LSFLLDARLAADTAVVGDLPLSRVLLMNDGNYPWLVLVPRENGLVELLDLSPADRARLIEEVALVAEALRRETDCDKLNVGAIGNIVAQLHVHVVARFRGDAAWPKPVWGAVPPAPRDTGEASALRRRLAEALSPHLSSVPG
jgi:diadenosine tetraphosphate (Ap4A) HIT family hydrolase